MSKWCMLFTVRSVSIIAFVAFLVIPARAQRPLGCDVSGYQPSINWTTVKNGGMTFAWAKATQGTGYTSPSFAAQEAGAKSVGIYIGAYHYATPSAHPNITGANSADSEAAYFWGVISNYTKYGGAYLTPMLDWEDVGATNQYSAATMSAWANEWCNSVALRALTNGVVLRPVIYTGTWYSKPSSTYSGLTTAVTNWLAWLSSYPSNPNAQTGYPGSPSSLSTFPWPSTWNIWQYADTNVSGGDSDVYNGTLASFVQTFVIGGTNAPSFTSPASLSVLKGSNATFSVTASGLAPLKYQWRFNGTNISGANSSNYTIVSAQLTNAGGYVVVVSNSYASVASSAAFLSVTAPLTNAAGAIIAPTSLVNWWPADGNGSDIFGANNATPYNGMFYTAGKSGMAFRFDGSTSYLLINNGTAMAANWTACMWVNRQNALGTSASLLGDTTYALKLEQYNATREVGFTKSGVADYLFSPAYIVPAGVWTHLAFVGTSAGITLYTNGVQEGTITATGLSLPRASIGADLLSGSAIDFMLGSLDEIQLFNRALNSTEIKGIYSAGSAGLVRAPEFTGISMPVGGQIQLNMRGQTGKTFTLYTSTNLVNWTSQGAIGNPVGTLQRSDSPTGPLKFYRITQP